ncbi:Mis12 protein-domain-containing protein [Xylariaceae sp. FL0594]|nr:Mis12 protein-domain-containing protein [Xylariaceae sp. FL0594]
MTTSTDSDTELLTEHFGYAPVSLIDDIINSVNILAERALNSVEQGLLKAGPSALGFKASKSQREKQHQEKNDAAAAPQLSPEERAKNEIESGTHQLETLLCASIDRNFDKFEIYVLRNIFTVRPPELRDWMRLSHYEGLDFSSSSSPSISRRRRAGDEDEAGNDATGAETITNKDSDAPTIESVTALRRRLRESMRLNALLTAERARNEALLEDLRRLVGDPASSKGTGPQIKSESTSPAGGAEAATTDARANANITFNVTDTETRDQEQDVNMPDAVTSALSEEEKHKTKSPFAFLHQKGDLASTVGGEAPLTTTAAFTLSQMQALRQLSSTLRKLAPELAKPIAAFPDDPTTSSIDGESTGTGFSGTSTTTTNGDSKKSWRRERVEYVETATRRHLETVHGLELGEHGEVRDGDWQGPGRSLARGEVEGLERIVAILGGGADEANANANTGIGHISPPVEARAQEQAQTQEEPLNRDKRGEENGEDVEMG